jgi:hypothetical protein
VARASYRGVLAACALLGVLMITRETRAYCRTTTCDPYHADAADACQYYSDGCPINGYPLFWTPACLSFSAQQDGSALQGISWETLNGALSTAYFNWMHADCGRTQVPSLQIFLRSPVYCSRVQYNTGADRPNANIWMFRDHDWPHDPGEVALTTVSFNPNTGEIYDADVELNSALYVFTMGDQDVLYDLASIVQHESGHTLGLAHAADMESTMNGGYSVGETKKRDLNADDALGICTLYPPNQYRGQCDPSPRHGFSGECTVPAHEASGCTFARPVRTGLSGAGGLGLALVGAWGWRWRRRRARV